MSSATNRTRDALQEIFFSALRRYFKTPPRNEEAGVRGPLADADHILREQDLPALPNDDPAGRISALFGTLRNLPHSGIREETVTMRRLGRPAQGACGSRVLAHLSEEFSGSDNFRTVMVHGSLASGDAIPGWSDLDVICVLEDEAVADAARLRSLRDMLIRLGRLCYAVDPLAHHEFSYLTVSDLSSYPRSFLPTEGWRLARLLAGERIMRIRVRDDASMVRSAITRMRSHFENRSRMPARNLFEFKNDLSMLMLMPALLLEDRGVYTDKKSSFRMAREHFPDADLAFVDIATERRREWVRRHPERFFPISVLTLPGPFGEGATRLLRRLADRPLSKEEMYEDRELSRACLALDLL